MPGEVLFTSVPSKDLPLVQRAMPDAVAVREPLSAELAARHPETQVLSVMVHDPVSEEHLAAFPRLRGVVTRSTGYDHLPLAWLEAHDVVVCNLGDYAVSSVVQHTILSILALLRRLPEAMAVTQGSRRGGRDPPQWDRSQLMGRNLADVRVGVLGTGRIGGAVVRALSALGASVTGHDVAPDPSLRSVPGFRYVDPFAAFLSDVDVLTVHVPLTAATRHLVDRQALSRLPTGAILVNTARGRVVDQLAVERALRAGRLAGYAADVLPGEPNPPHLSRFRDFTNVILTPHLGAYDTRAVDARYGRAAEAARLILQGDQQALRPYRVPRSTSDR